MALNSYVNLKASIRDWSHRNDMEDSLLDDFIDLAEQDMYHNSDMHLNIRDMEKRATATVSTTERFLALPDGFIQMRRLKLNLAQGDTDLKFMAPDQLLLQGVSGQPKFYTVTSQLGFDRTPDTAYTIEMQYFASETPLSDANTTNDVLTTFPKVYLYGALSFLYSFTIEPELETKYRALFLDAIRGANTTARAGRYGSAPFIRTEGSTP